MLRTLHSPIPRTLQQNKFAHLQITRIILTVRLLRGFGTYLPRGSLPLRGMVGGFVDDITFRN